MAGLPLPRQSQRTGSKLQKFYTFDAEDFMQRTIILCNLLFSIGKVMKAVVSKKMECLTEIIQRLKLKIETNSKEGGGISSPLLKQGVSMPRL